MSGKNKGSQFERDVCRELSLWWSHGERDDIFWRSVTSGARATQRSKSRKQTHGQYGDIQATDPIGQPLLCIFCFELKRGYPNASVSDLIECDNGGQFGKWLKQAWKSTKLGGSFYPILLTKRNQRAVVICYPAEFTRFLIKFGGDRLKKCRSMNVFCTVGPFSSFVVMRFEDFIQCLDSKHVPKILHRLITINAIRLNNGNHECHQNN